MHIEAFRRAFWSRFDGPNRNRPDPIQWDAAVLARQDLCPDVPGMLSLRKQQLLNLAFGLLPPGEAYLEVGTFAGKSLISAMLHSPVRTVYAVDNFSEFEGNSLSTTQAHLARYGMLERVHFLDCDFREALTPGRIETPIGLYFYDGAHDEESQHMAIRLVEPLLADEALVIVDDWRFAPDSRSYAKAGTLRAIRKSEHQWRLICELPARFNGDLGLWWNGVGIFAFRRVAAAVSDALYGA